MAIPNLSGELLAVSRHVMIQLLRDFVSWVLVIGLAQVVVGLIISGGEGWLFDKLRFVLAVEDTRPSPDEGAKVRAARAEAERQFFREWPKRGLLFVLIPLRIAFGAPMIALALLMLSVLPVVIVLFMALKYLLDGLAWLIARLRVAPPASE